MMIKAINYIKDFGVFGHYTKSTEIDDFSKKNTVYGWNYSGKTTLSRVFQCLQNGKIDDYYAGASFEIELEDQTIINEKNLTSFHGVVRVFNSDFIKDNLSFDGEAFDPILLLGDSSIELEKEIANNDKKIERCHDLAISKQRQVEVIEEKIRNEKTKKALSIRRQLSLVETYTSTHINSTLPIVKKDPEQYIVEGDEYSNLLKLSLTNEDDKLPLVSQYSVVSQLTTAYRGLRDLLSKTPEMSNTIEYLAENQAVSAWVKSGLTIHEGKDTCEFCKNPLKQERLTELNSHFSKDLQEHENSIKAHIKLCDELKIDFKFKHTKDFYPRFQEKVDKLHKTLGAVIETHNMQIEKVKEALTEKLKSQYVAIELPYLLEADDLQIDEPLKEINNLITANNEITKNFSKQKLDAIKKLKKHYIAEFVIDTALHGKEFKKRLLTRHVTKLRQIEKNLVSKNLQLEAQIRDAQKGREELNEFIGKFLNDSQIQINVITVEDRQRFVLMRGPHRAKNLSEGEKTAIAFSFFLVKLKEIANLSQAIIYIDDPISSLDSNHLFQVNAVMKEFFFWQDSSDGNQWKSRVKQIFFSTHNFEFLSLLKELPKKGKLDPKGFLIKRLSEQESTISNLPESIKRYSSEYHYLWDVIYTFYNSTDKSNIEVLLGLPNAMRRFIELYTYSKIPNTESVDDRANELFGVETSKRIMKVLHHFSHQNNIHMMVHNNDLMSDIENVVDELVELIKQDKLHFDALVESM